MYKRKYPPISRRKRMLCLYVTFLTALSISFLLMPFVTQTENETMLLVFLTGILFWIGLIGTIVVYVFIAYSKQKSKEFRKRNSYNKRLGIMHFFQNVWASVFDVVMFLSLIGFTITCIWMETTYLPFIFLSVFSFSFGMHCMLNGSNYTYINNRIRRENTNE